MERFSRFYPFNLRIKRINISLNALFIIIPNKKTRYMSRHFIYNVFVLQLFFPFLQLI